MEKFIRKTITIGYNLRDWIIGIQFVIFYDGSKHFGFLCFYIEW